MLFGVQFTQKIFLARCAHSHWQSMNTYSKTFTICVQNLVSVNPYTVKGIALTKFGIMWLMQNGLPDIL